MRLLMARFVLVVAVLGGLYGYWVVGMLVAYTRGGRRLGMPGAGWICAFNFGLGLARPVLWLPVVVGPRPVLWRRSTG